MSTRILKFSLPFAVAACMIPAAAFATDEMPVSSTEPTASPAASDELPTMTEGTPESEASAFDNDKYLTAPSTTTTTTPMTSTTTPVAANLNDDDDDDDDGLIGNALVTPAGVYGFLGGGATNFTQSEANGSTEAGGYWDARVGIGTRSILGGEVAYVGSARDINALGAGSEAFLVSNGVEGVARLNLPITPDIDIGNDDSEDGKGSLLLEPYTFGGIGWNRYNVVSDASLTADWTNEDDIMTVPVGVGMAFGAYGFTLDTRATYRQAIGSDLLGSETSSFADSSLNSWAAGAALGFEF